MDEKNNGGPAFPEQLAVTPTGDTYSGHEGMTLRDYFAAQALPGFLSTCEREPGGATSSLDASAIARASYELADAMLAERAK
jgi:hypothetical protein